MANSALPGIPVELPPSGPTPVGSLVASAANPPSEFYADGHWTGGLRWVPEACKNGQIDDYCTETALALSDGASVLPFEHPYVVEAGYRGSALGRPDADEFFRQKAVNALLRNQSRLIELEFADGLRTRTAGYNNFFLSNNNVDEGATDTTFGSAPPKAIDVATVLTGTSYTIRKAFGALEYMTMQGLGGGKCMIHVPAFVVPYLTQAQIIDQVGPLLLTKLGNIIVAGVGYTGSAPGTANPPSAATIDATQATTWFYGTDIVTLWLEKSAVVTQSQISEGLDKSINRVEYRATRFAATTVNRCVLYAVKVDLAGS